MDSFPIIARKDDEKWGDYRTKRAILDVYDSLGEAIISASYVTALRPKPAADERRHPKKPVGVLAYGSLIRDPGPELEAKITMRIKTSTPFPVEYARISGKTRAGAPTLAPHSTGSPVNAEILVMEDDVSLADAKDMLWRRERRKEGGNETYVEGESPNSVLVREFHDSPWVATLLYTDFHTEGKIAEPNADDLAARAIASVGSAKENMDGISYLMAATASGIETKLTPAYRQAILKQTASSSLTEALDKARSKDPDTRGAQVGS